MPLTTRQIREDIDKAVADLAKAADDAGLTSDDAYRMMSRIQSTIVTHATTTLCGLLDETGRVGKELKMSRDDDRAALRQMVASNARSVRACIVVTVSGSVIAAVVCLFAVGGTRKSVAAMAVDLASPALIECGQTAREVAGEYHCSMRVTLKSTRTRR